MVGDSLYLPQSTGIKWISQGFLYSDTLWSDIGFFELKNRASIVTDAFYRLQ